MIDITRTARGEQENEVHALPLSVPARRLLKMIGAGATRESLAANSRFGEWERVLEELVHRGLVTIARAGDPQAGHSATATEIDAPPTTTQEASAPAAAGAAPLPARPPMDSQQLTQAKRDAVHFIHETFGPMGDSFSIKIEKTKTAEALAAELANLRRVMYDMGQRAAADGLYERVIVPWFGARES